MGQRFRSVVLFLSAGMATLIAPAAQAGCGDYKGQFRSASRADVRCKKWSGTAPAQMLATSGFLTRVMSWGTRTRLVADTPTSRCEDSIKCCTAATPINHLGASKCVVSLAMLVDPALQSLGLSEQWSMSFSPGLSDVAISFEGNVPQILLLQLLGGHAGQCDLSDLIH